MTCAGVAAAQPTAEVPVEPAHAGLPFHDEDAWEWGGEAPPEAHDYVAAGWPPAKAHPAAAVAGDDPDWFEHPLVASARPMMLPEERAAQALEALASQLRAGSLTLDARAALDSEEAVLATVLAALFARRVR